jgi:hypothetical protein
MSTRLDGSVALENPIPQESHRNARSVKRCGARPRRSGCSIQGSEHFGQWSTNTGAVSPWPMSSACRASAFAVSPQSFGDRNSDKPRCRVNPLLATGRAARRVPSRACAPCCEHEARRAPGANGAIQSREWVIYLSQVIPLGPAAGPRIAEAAPTPARSAPSSAAWRAAGSAPRDPHEARPIRAAHARTMAHLSEMDNPLSLFPDFRRSEAHDQPEKGV